MSVDLIVKVQEKTRLFNIHLRRSDAEGVVVDDKLFVLFCQHGGEGVAHHLTEFDKCRIGCGYDEDAHGVGIAVLVGIFVASCGQSLRLNDKVRDFILALILLRTRNGEDACTFLPVALSAQDGQQVVVATQRGYESRSNF